MVLFLLVFVFSLHINPLQIMNMEELRAPSGLSILLLVSRWLIFQLLHHQHIASVCTLHPLNLLWTWIFFPKDSKQLCNAKSKNDFLVCVRKWEKQSNNSFWFWVGSIVYKETYQHLEVLPFVSQMFSSFHGLEQLPYCWNQGRPGLPVDEKKKVY